MNKLKLIVPCIIFVVVGFFSYQAYTNSLAYLTSQYETTKQHHINAQEALLLKKLDLAEECVKEDRERCKLGNDGVIEVTKRLHKLLPNKYEDWKPRYDTPDDLFYTYLSEEKVDISQTPRQHYARNGLLATDVATYDKPLTMYAPDLKGEEVEYDVEYWDDYEELGRAMVLTSGNQRFIIGHIKSTLDESTVETGSVIGITLCPGDPNAGITTGCHAHIMYQVNTVDDWQAAEYKIEKNYLKHKEWKRKRDSKNAEIENKGWYVKKGFDVFSPGIVLVKVSWDAPVYQNAAEEFGIDWRILSAVHLRERHRNITKAESSAGAQGAMQFLPCTWFNWGADVRNPEGCYTEVNVKNAFSDKYDHPRGYATDGDGDGIADINNPHDAIYSAAKMIKNNIDKCGGVQCALYVYNNADWYVEQVMGFAYEMGLPYPTK